MLELIIMALIYGAIASIFTAAAGWAINVIFFKKKVPSKFAVILCMTVGFFIALGIIDSVVGDSIGLEGVILSSLVSMFAFYKTVEI
ncbi:hypothetical protein YA36_14290 [Klebsiella aerogenes]|uniref:hypothetical protein n=1 Tax=Klebsiella aerogenes TaxID=548 RepID=UPI00063CA44E|nr:hypothetical protein [Klebsiella aerogenes]KLF56392.1 hypothetical protein YA36_14290 [Klebsiella aerogenes]